MRVFARLLLIALGIGGGVPLAGDAFAREFSALGDSCVQNALLEILRYGNPHPYDREPLKIGIEVEGRVDRSVGMKGLAAKAEEVLKTRFERVELHDLSDQQEPYFTVAFWTSENKKKSFSFHEDASIPETRKLQGVELTSPILETGEEREAFREVMDGMKEAGMVAMPTRAGVHVHVDFHSGTDLGSKRDLVALQLLFSRIEDETLRVFSAAKGRAKFAKPLASGMRDYLERLAKGLATDEGKRIALRPVTHDEINAIVDGRFKALNIQALKKYGTVEFRLFNSTMDSEKIELMADFAEKLVKAVRTQDPKLIRYLEATPWDQISAKGIASALHMKFADADALLEEIAAAARENASRWELSDTGRRVAVATLIGSGVAGAVKVYDSLHQEDRPSKAGRKHKTH